MFVCCECCVLSGRGLCDELITRPEESYRLWCVVVCDLENLKNEEAITSVGSQRHSKKKTVCTTRCGSYILTWRDLMYSKTTCNRDNEDVMCGKKLINIWLAFRNFGT